MRTTVLALVVGVTATLPPPAPADDADKAKKQDKAVRELVGKVVTAIGEKDIDTLVAVSDYPWCRDPKNYDRDEKSLRQSLRAGLQEKPAFDAKYEIKSVETLGKVKGDLGEGAAKGYLAVMTEGDYVVHVEVDGPKRKFHSRLLVKMVNGSPRLVGIGDETRAE